MKPYTTREMAYKRPLGGSNKEFRLRADPVEKYLEITSQIRALVSSYDPDGEFYRKAKHNDQIVALETKARFWYNFIAAGEMPRVTAALSSMRNMGRG